MKILLMSLMLAAVSDYSWASNNTRRHKPHTKHLRTQGMLHPFVLRLLYTPNYRLLSQHWQDRAAEGETVAQLLPFAGGIEGELLFHDLLSLTLGGNFVWVDPIVEDEQGQQEGVNNNLKEINLWSSCYFKVKNYVKVGGGLTFSRRSLETSVEGDGFKRAEVVSYYTMSAHLDLRRDFFFNWGGVGVGLNIAMPFIAPFKATATGESYENGELKHSTEKDLEEDDEKEDLELFAFVISPMLYYAF